MATDRLVRVLEQYRDRLHNQGDQNHDEELDYLRQVLESPFMMEYLKGKTSQEDAARIEEATTEVLSAFADKGEEGRLSPQTRRKRQLARQRSLRALKMAVTPQGSPSSSTRVVKKKSVGATDSPLLQSLAVAHGDEATPYPPQPSLDHIYISPYTGKMERGASLELPKEEERDEGEGIRLGDEESGLSNSANTLIERTSTPLSDSSITGNGGLYLPHPGINNMPADFTNKDVVPHNGFVSPSGGRLPPSYNEALSSRRRARSFEKLIETPSLAPGPIPMRPTSSAMTPSSYPVHPATSGTPTQNFLTGYPRGNLVTARLIKGDRGLGISISGVKSPKKGELNVYIQELQPGGVAEVDGTLQPGDQIVSINGRSLSGVGYKAAVAMLQQARGTVELVILRDTTSSAQPVRPPPSYQPASPMKSHVRPPGPPSPCRRQLATIVLPNEGRGFGVRVTTIALGCSVVESILPGSVAERDGRLRTGDQLVQINGEEVLNFRHEDIITRLRAISNTGETLRMVVSREAPHDSSDEEDDDVSPFDSSDELEEEEVLLRKPLGITIAGIVSQEGGEDRGIVVKLVNPEKSAGQSGRVKKGDFILGVDGVSLRGLSNMAAASQLRESGNPVRLVLGRKLPKMVKKEEEEKERDHPHSNSKRSSLSPVRSSLMSASKDKTGQRETQESNEREEEEEEEEEKEEEGRRVTKPLNVYELKTKAVERVSEDFNWETIIGPNKVVKVAHITKTDAQGGLGFNMETIVEVDDTGLPQFGSGRHVIQHIREDGPIGLNGILKVDDEILEVNSYALVGASHEQAIEIIRTAPTEVRVVVCRARDRGSGDNQHGDQKQSDSTNLAHNDESSDVPLFATSESDDDHGSSSATPSITSSSSPALHSSILSSDIPAFSRRFERQSWRERHEEERKRLWERFELRREYYNRHLKEQEEELLRAEKELEERKKKMEEVEEKRRQEAEEKKSSLLTGHGFDYSSTYHTSMRFFNTTESGLSGADSHTDSQRDSDSSSALSPVPGSGLWETSVTEVELMKGPEGLGFSILDFADPAHTGDKVILVCSLVQGGVASRDNRLQVGDRLLSVNGVSVVNHSLQFAVQQLTSIQHGVVHLVVNHPIPASPDLESTSSSFSPDTVQQLIQNVMSNEGEDTMSEGEEENDDKRSTLKQGASLEFDEDDEEENSVVRTFEKLHVSSSGSRSSRKDSTASDGYSWRSSDREDVVTPQLKPDGRSSLKRSSRAGSSRSYKFEEDTRVGTSQLASGSQGASPRPMLSKQHAVGHAENQPTTGVADLSRSSTLVGSVSEETLVSSSMQDIHQATASSKVPQPGKSHVAGRKKVGPYQQQLDPRLADGRGYRRPHGACGDITTATSAIVFTPTQSQDSIMEGLSPDTSDTGEPPDTDAEPRLIEIEKGSGSLGMSIAEDKGFFVVKKIDASSLLAYDQRIRVGDRILAINNKLLDGLPLQKARGVLKRASSSKSPTVKITYLPGQPHQGFSLSYNSSKADGSSTATAALHHPPPVPQPTPHYTPGQTLSHSIPLTTLNPMMPQSAAPLHSTIPVPGPSNLSLNMQQQQQQTFRWVQSQQLQQYNPPTGLSPRGHYLEHPTPIKPIPHMYTPYGDSTMATGMINPTQPAQQYHPQQVPWSMEYAAMTHQATPPQGVWVAYHREPPQYGQFLQTSQYQQPAPSQLHQQPMMAPAAKNVPAQQQQHHGTQDGDQMMNPHRRPPPAYPHGGMVDNFNQYQQQQAYDSSHYEAQQGNMEEKDHQQKPGMWHQDSAGSIFSDRTGSGGGTGYSGLPVSVQELQGRPRMMELKRDSAGSLGISLCPGEGSVGGVYIMSLSPACQAASKGRLNPGDQILEVNGRDLRRATQAEAVNVIKMAGNPVRIVVQSSTRSMQHSSPLHSNNSSWALDEDESDRLRQRFPNANGHLFEVVLHMGQTGLKLGLSIWQMNTSQSSLPRGVVVMQVQPGGVADQSGKIKVGDEILQVNDVCVLGWSHQKVSELLSQSPSVVSLVIARPVPVSGLQQTLRLSDQLQRGHVEGYQSTPDGGSGKPSAGGGGGGGGSGGGASGGSDPRGSKVDLLSGLSVVQSVTLRRDDELGLGFTVSEVDSKVIITDIISGGPANLEGTLQVGDQILYVDSHHVVGMKYERATNLLQQARANGSVNLVVSSKGQATQHRAFSGKKSLKKKPKEMAEKRLRVRSEGINVRNKMGKIPRLGSRRRPVSVDGDIAYGGSTEQKGPELSGTTELSSHSELLTTGAEQGKKEVFPTPSVQPGEGGGGGGVSTDDQDVEVVELWKSGQSGLGMMIVEDEIQGGIVVDRLVPGEVAHLSGKIRPGDKILAVNRENVSSSTQSHVIQLLQACRGSVELTVRHMTRGHTSLPPPPDHTDTPPASYGQHYSEFSNSSSARGSGRSKKSHGSHGQDSLSSFTSPHSRGGRGATPLQKDTSLEKVEEDDYLHKQSLYRDVVGQSLPDSRQPVYQQPPPTTTVDFQQAGNIKVIHLKRGSAGLGFSIVGGKGSPNGDLPICVKSVSKDSAAGRDGGLKPRDVILAVNGVSFRNVTHQFAVSTLKRLQGDIEVVAQTIS